MVNTISEQSPLPALLKNLTKEVSSSNSESAVSYNSLLDKKGLIPKIEKHIDDVKKGKGYLSKTIAKQIGKERQNSATELSQINPSLSKLYNSFSTGLSYSRQARFVTGIGQSIETTRRLLDLYS